MERLPENCSEIQATLPLYVGADLEAPAMDAVGAHLAVCAPCAALHERSRGARSALRELRRHQGRTASPVSIWEGIRERLLAEGLIAPRGEVIPFARAQVTTVASGPRPMAPSRRFWGGVAAAAALMLAGSLFVYSLYSTGEPRLELAPGPESRTIADAEPVSTSSSDEVAASHVEPVSPDEDAASTGAELASSGEDAWMNGIRPLRPAGSEDPFLLDRALSGEGQRVLDPSMPGMVRTVNGFWIPRLR